jgi:hypothetical protein
VEAVDVQNYHLLHAQVLRSSTIKEYIFTGLRFKSLFLLVKQTGLQQKGP